MRKSTSPMPTQTHIGYNNKFEMKNLQFYKIYKLHSLISFFFNFYYDLNKKKIKMQEKLRKKNEVL